jgi:GNAT superfamily N-acetyltransferase
MTYTVISPVRPFPNYFGIKLTDPIGLAIIDLVEYHPDGVTQDGWIITRINVPPAHRGKGLARALLAECLRTADDTKTTLWLEIAESDGLSFAQLEAWYLRHGFKNLGGIYRRRPIGG